MEQRPRAECCSDTVPALRLRVPCRDRAGAGAAGGVVDAGGRGARECPGTACAPGIMALQQSLRLLQLDTRGEGFTEISSSGLDSGIAVISCLHTSASLTVNENADPRVLADLTAYLRALVPQEGVRPLSGQGSLRPYAHDDEGPDDMPAHIRTALTSSSLSQSFQGRRLLLGTWQAIYLWEHRAQPQRRRISLHLLGE